MQELKLIKKKKKVIETILIDIVATNDKEKKFELYKDILKIDNTNRDIVLQYLLLVKQIRKMTDDDPNPVVEIMTYIHHFPVEQYNKDFIGFGEKKNSSMGKILLFFKKIISKDWIKTTFEEKKEFFSFILKVLNEDKFEIKNTSPITWENDELYIFNLYMELLSQIKRKIEYYESSNNINDIQVESDKIKECDKHIKEMKEKLLEPNHSEIFIIKTKKLIEKAEKNRKLYLIIEGNFFHKYLSGFNFFLCGIQDTYLKELSTIKFSKVEDKEIFEYFMLFISHYNFENITTVKYLVWKSSFTNQEKDIKIKSIELYKLKDPPMEMIFEKDNKLIIKAKNINEIIIKNYDDYELENLLSDIYENRKFNEVKALKYIKINKIKDHLYIKKIFDKWIIFNLSIFNSRAIKSLYLTLYEKQIPFVFDVDELTTVLKNITFYSFNTDFEALTDRETMKIYEYANYENLIDLYDKELLNEDVLKVIFLAFNLIINFHEILGHFNIRYQIYSYGEEEKKNYESPKVNEDLSSDYAKGRKGKESGEYIEIKLFGRVIRDLTLKEALFIINPSNYFQNDFNSFKKKFMKCNDEKMNIDENFWFYLVNSLKINPKKILEAENKRYSLDDLIKKSSNNREKFKMKRKHPIGYNIDGLQKEDYEYINDLIERIKDLDEKNNDDKDSNK